MVRRVVQWTARKLRHEEDETAATRAYLAAPSDSQRARMAGESRDAPRQAWPHRAGLRGRIVVRANVAQLRDLRGPEMAKGIVVRHR